MKRITALLLLLAVIISSAGCVSLPEPSDTSSKTELGNTETSNTEPSNTEPGNTESSNTEPGNTEPGNTEPKPEDPTEPEPTEPEPTEPEPTESEPPVPSGYKYDFGSIIENPTADDFQLLYDTYMSGIPFPSFGPETDDISRFINSILDFSGRGLLFAFNFSFYNEYVDPTADEFRQMGIEVDEFMEESINNGMQTYMRYYIEDIEWLLMALYGIESDLIDISSYYADAFCYEQYFYRHAAEQYMGNPGAWCTDFEAEYESLGNGQYKFSIDLKLEVEYEGSFTYHVDLIATPMHSSDVGTYWRILSHEETYESN